MNRPYSRWFWRDHEQDLNLFSCHPFAQGIWMRMQAIMAQGEPYGYLRMEPRKAAQQPTPPAKRGKHGGVQSGHHTGDHSGDHSGDHPGDHLGVQSGDLGDLQKTRYTLPKSGSLEHQIYARCGITQEQMQWVIAHLEEHGVFSRDERGIIYSRRMKREAEIHAQHVERARRGREKYQRKKHPTPPDGPAGKSPQKRGKAVNGGVQGGHQSGHQSGHHTGDHSGVQSGDHSGAPIPITRINYNPTPPTPPFSETEKRGDNPATPEPQPRNPKPPRGASLADEARALVARKGGPA